MNCLRHVLISFLLAGPVLAAEDSIGPAAARLSIIERGSALLKPKPLAELGGAATNPFTLNGSRTGASQVESHASLSTALASNKNILNVLADRLESKGTFVVGGDAIILIGQKKLKVGEKLPISFEGAIYELEITSIETTRFSVRYKNEEITRSIVTTKPAK